MADNKKMVEAITDMNVDFAKWYTDIVKKADLCDYSSIKGCMILRPYGYQIWDRIKNEIDRRLVETGHENVYMPMFISESLLQKEADHVEGFAPEVAWVTHSGETKLAERMCVRPTSETLFCEHYHNLIQSHRDLPVKYNQWCSVVRMEKNTRPFLRTTEFLWQEGHTAHATAEEALEETLGILDMYASVCEDLLAIPMVKGIKTQKEKFAGAKNSYTIEALMHDGKSLQSGTSHDFSDGFAKAFDITYTNKDNVKTNVFQTSWGVTTRLIGALIMVHSDNNGLVLPPNIAPIQAVIVPIMQNKEGVLDKAFELKDILSSSVRTKVDDSDKSPGFKFSENEMKGIPVRIEIGPKDIEQGQCVVVRRDTREKTIVPLADVKSYVDTLLVEMHNDLLNKALEHREAHTYVATNYDELCTIANEKSGFIKTMWCGETECEEKVKEDLSITSRCMPFKQEILSDTCPICGKPSKHMIYWGKAY